MGTAGEHCRLVMAQLAPLSGFSGTEWPTDSQVFSFIFARRPIDPAQLAVGRPCFLPFPART
jgi:hypothetical protein